MMPYFDDGQIQIWCGDCRGVLPLLPRHGADLILTDPPYGISWVGRGQHAMIEGDDGSLDVVACVKLALRALRANRHIYVFGPMDWSDLPTSDVVDLVWDKGKHSLGDLSIPWGSSHERIGFAVHKPYPSMKATASGRLAARIRRGTVLRYPKVSNGRGAIDHPTEKPITLLRELIEASSCFDETVLDPFMGTGSTLVAARLEGRKAIGIELSETYCEIAVRRLAQSVMQLGIA